MSGLGAYDVYRLPSGRVKALDEFLDLPHLNILLSSIDGLGHGWTRFDPAVKK
jgi:hypothetical protein